MRQSNWHEFMEINLNALELMKKKKKNFLMKSWIWKTEIFALDLRGRVFYSFYILSSSTSITITKQRNSLLGICHTPSQRGGGEKVISYFIYISSKSCTIKKLRWSTRYSWLNRCNSSEYYSWKVALGPRRSGLTDELLEKRHLTLFLQSNGLVKHFV